VNQAKYIGMDVHQATISVAVMDSAGKLILESLLETKAATILQFLDFTRVMSRIKAVYRSWAIPCAGSAVYRPRHRAEWLAKIVEPGVRLRAERLCWPILF
jgi:hypothetical protein